MLNLVGRKVGQPRSCNPVPWCPMAKKKPDTESIRLSTEVTRRARIIAAARGVSLPAWLEEKVGEIVAKELPAVLRDLGMDGGTTSAKK